MFNVLRRLGVIVLVVCAVARPAGAEDAVKIAVLGDSLSAGFGLMAHEAFPAQLEARLRELGVEVSVLNAGVSGDTSAGGVARVDWVLGDNPHFVILELGANDGLRGHDPATLEDKLRSIVRRTRARRPDVRVVIVGMEAPPNLGQTYTDRFREIFGIVARDTGSALVPFLLEGVAGVPELNQDDRIHPTAEGHKRPARNVWTVLEGVLLELEMSR